MTTAEFFQQHPEHDEVLRVGDDLFFPQYRHSADQFAASKGLIVQTITRVETDGTVAERSRKVGGKQRKRCGIPVERSGNRAETVRKPCGKQVESKWKVSGKRQKAGGSLWNGRGNKRNAGGTLRKASGTPWNEKESKNG
jgi:hypothetical protein